MSSVTNHHYIESNITSVFFKFGFRWALKTKELRDLSSQKVSVIHSDLFTYRTIKDLNFHLCLEYKVANLPWPYEVSIKGSKMWAFQTLNPYILTKERAYSLGPFHHVFLERFGDKCLSDDEEYIEIHCIIDICPMNPVSPVKDESPPLDCLRTIDVEMVPHLPLPSDYTNETVISYMKKGELPRLNVSVAIKIISEFETHKCDVLKILCTEYLLMNISAGNLRLILKAAIDFNVPRLERRCTEKISMGCFKIK